MEVFVKLPVIVMAVIGTAAASGCGSDTANLQASTPTEITMTDDKPTSPASQITDKIEVMPLMIGKGADSVTFAADKCVIRADFSSIGTGIDSAAEARLVDFIAKTEVIPYAAKQGYGKEGEVAYCIDVARDVNAVHILKNLRAAVGEADKGGVNIRMIVDY